MARRSLSVLAFPSDDEALLRLVEGLVREPAVADPPSLEAALRPLYPAIVVRDRAIAGETVETWYVYRDGAFVARGRHDAQWDGPDAAWVTYGSDGKVLGANDLFATAIGATSAAALVGRSYLDFVAPDAAPLVTILFHMAEEGQTIASTARMVRGDGTTVDVQHRTWRTPEGVKSVIRSLQLDSGPAN